MTRTPELVAVGLDHRTAGIELRERVAFAVDEIPAALARLTDPAGGPLEQAAILSTCNRVELYGVAPQPVTDALASFLARYRSLEPDALANALYVHRRDEVPRHLAATAAGMHSLMLGEAQIQGQVRTALELALAAGTAGPELRRLFEAAIAASRRVRARTGLGRGSASVPHASVALVRQRLGTLRDSKVLLIGAGTTSELVAKQVVGQGARELLVVARDAVRAEAFAQRYGGRVITSDRLGEALAHTDVVFSATSAACPVVHRRQVERALARRRRGDAPLLLIDLAVPRDVDPEVAALTGVEVHTIDDLRDVVERTLAQRRAHLPAAHAIVGAEVTRFTGWLRRRAALGQRPETPMPRAASRSVIALRSKARRSSRDMLGSSSPAAPWRPTTVGSAIVTP